MSKHEIPLNPAEAVFGFAAWLSCRSKPLILSELSDCGELAKLLGMFIEVNNIGDPSENYPANLRFPLED
jgi:hypothetical protein